MVDELGLSPMWLIVIRFALDTFVLIFQTQQSMARRNVVVIEVSVDTLTAIAKIIEWNFHPFQDQRAWATSGDWWSYWHGCRSIKTWPASSTGTLLLCYHQRPGSLVLGYRHSVDDCNLELPIETSIGQSRGICPMAYHEDICSSTL